MRKKDVTTPHFVKITAIDGHSKLSTKEIKQIHTSKVNVKIM